MHMDYFFVSAPWEMESHFFNPAPPSKDGGRPRPKIPSLTLGGPAPPQFASRGKRSLIDTTADPLPVPIPKSAPSSLTNKIINPPDTEPCAVRVSSEESSGTLLNTSSLVLPTSHPPEMCRISRGLFQTSLQHWSLAKTQYEQWLAKLILAIGTPSQIFVEFAGKPTYPTVIKQLLAQVGPSTLDLYSRSVETTENWMRHIGITWEQISLNHLVTIIQFAQEASKQDVQAIRLQPPQLLRGLRWLARTTLMEQLATILSSFLMASFLKGPQKPKDRKEAIPIPMILLLRWEETILSPLTPQWLTLLLGGFLLAAWGSLRFADLQRTQVSSLNLATDTLRGLCRITKTTRTGQPFAIAIAGFTAFAPTNCWVVTWLRVVQKAFYRSSPFLPDFIIPVLDNYNEPTFSSPLSYAAALRALRWAAQTPWTVRTFSSEMAQMLTLHSLKVTFLAAAAQLRLPMQARRQQGHHSTGSAELYSRDDVVEAVWLQQQIAQEIRRGWRPLRPLQRGAQKPTPEPSFVLPFAEMPSKIEIPWEPALALFQVEATWDTEVTIPPPTVDSSDSHRKRRLHTSWCRTHFHHHQEPSSFHIQLVTSWTFLRAEMLPFSMHANQLMWTSSTLQTWSLVGTFWMMTTSNESYIPPGMVFWGAFGVPPLAENILG